MDWPMIGRIGMILMSIVLICSILGCINFWRTCSLLKVWADGRGYEVLSARPGLIRLGPYFWNRSQGQIVYRLRLREGGVIVSGWARCGSTWGGALVRPDVIEMTLDDGTVVR